jgi:transcriptional regulator of arginine metabolism
MKKNKKKMRQEALKELIGLYPVEDQTTLASLLKQKYNIDTNQSIISRDLRELHVSKKVVDDISVYDLENQNSTLELLIRSIHTIVHNEVLIIVNTVPGLASFVGDYLDQQKLSGVIGTLAGENVLFVAPTSIKNIASIYVTICKALHYKIKKEGLA